MRRHERSVETDATVANLDRGWDLLQRGELVGARVAAHQILQLEAESAEAHTLLGAIAAAEGDFDEAMELLHQAMDLDADSLEPVLYAAEVAVLCGDADEALDLCRLGRELIADPEEVLDVGLLELEALVVGERKDEARRAALALPDLAASPVPAYWLRAGRAWLDLDEPARAEALLRLAADRPEAELDARYFLGLALEHQGRDAEAVEQFLRVCDLDRQEPDPAWTYSQEDLEALVRATVQELPAALRELLSGVDIRVLPQPPAELVADGMDPRATVYLAGTATAPTSLAAPTPGAGDWFKAAAPTCLFVYKRPLERHARSGAEIPVELRAALEDEARLALGLTPGEGGSADG
jgi:tetratricopeptide (TPR) repeat protein